MYISNVTVSLLMHRKTRTERQMEEEKKRNITKYMFATVLHLDCKKQNLDVIVVTEVGPRQLQPTC